MKVSPMKETSYVYSISLPIWCDTVVIHTRVGLGLGPRLVEQPLADHV